MEPFEIEITGIHYKVEPLENGNFQVSDSEKLLGTVKPEQTDSGVTWTSNDGITPDFATQIGELIEEHDM
ncbi:hypothetical protein D3C87_719910 [compost metagenome]